MKYNFDNERNDYLTPPELWHLALDTFTIHYKFALDVCCSVENIPANAYFKFGEKDGLKEDWAFLNWCNPPFDECKKWIKKAYDESLKGNKTIMLLPVRTETKYWHDYILYNKHVKILWLRKGYSFLNADTGEPMGVFKNALALVCFNGVKI